MPGLGDSVDNALQRINSQDPQIRDLGHKILLWLCMAGRQFKMDELFHGIAVVDGDEDCEEDGLIPPEIMLTSCAGLVETDVDSGIVRLVHLSVKEHLKEHLEAQKPAWLVDRHFPLLQATTTYLGFKEFNSSADFDKDDFLRWTEQYPFLSYAAENWAVHCRGIPEESLIPRVMSLLSDQDRAQFLLRAAYAATVGDPSLCPSNVTELHVVAFFGLDVLVEPYAETDSGVNAADVFGRQPLFLAAARGHDLTVKKLLDLNANSSGRLPIMSSSREFEGWLLPPWARPGARASAIEVAAEAGFGLLSPIFLRQTPPLDVPAAYMVLPLKPRFSKGMWR